MSRERLWPLLQRGSLCASEDVQLIILLVSAMHKQGRLRPPYPITLLGTNTIPGIKSPSSATTSSRDRGQVTASLPGTAPHVGNYGRPRLIPLGMSW